jgi:3' terminal RNA ribose 2'-O-methyltransferase Hen1
VAARFLKYRSSLAREALARLRAEDEADASESDEQRESDEAVVEERIHLGAQRIGAVLGALRVCGATSVLDLGCGEGRLLRELLKDRQFSRIAGVDVSVAALERARDKLHLDSMPERQRDRIALLHGSLCCRDARFSGFDAACAIEVIEHIEPDRLAAFERVVFGEARPRTVLVTTPNAEYNVRFENLPAGRFRHRDHRFEWSRGELAAWSTRVAERFGYSVRLLPIGTEDAEVGAPTQMAVFTL